MYQCDKCGKEFKYKYLYKNHENRKYDCNSIDNIDNIYNNKINLIQDEIKIKTELSINKKDLCYFCNLTLSINTNIKRHINEYCKVKKILVDNIEKIKNEKLNLIHQQQINKLKEENNILKNNNSNNTINNITINNINNINNVNNTQNNLVIMNPFGKEDLSHLKIQDYIKYLNGFFPGFVGYIDKVHFDENMPQNHNICISNLRSKYISIHDGTKWITKDKNDVIDSLILKKHNQLSSICEQLGNEKKIDRNVIENFEEFCESFKNKDAQKTIKTNIVTMLYDNKHKIKFKKK
jgi:hypothetical protein